MGEYNVIAGNGGSGDGNSSLDDSGNRIYYNYLGVNDGGTDVINGSTNNIGVLIGNGAKNNGAWGNVIAGNRYGGVVVASGDGNWIGIIRSAWIKRRRMHSADSPLELLSM